LYLNCLEQVKDEDITFKRQYEVGTTYFWNIFKGIVKRELQLSKELIDRLTNIWRSIVFDYLLEEGFRYKLLQSICNESTLVEDIHVDDKLKYAFSDLSLQVKWEDYRYYIYIIQFIIKTNRLNNTHLDILINIIEERKLDNNGIADISDFLIGLKENNSSYLLFDNIDEYTCKGKELLEKISLVEFKGKKGDKIYSQDVPSSIVVNNTEYSIGVGGLHSVEKNRAIIAQDDEYLIDIDVVSYYPSIILNNEYSPEHFDQKAFIKYYCR
jgi:hypothetical protein